MSKDDEIAGLLKELVKWTKAVNIPIVRERLLDTFPTPEEKTAYELSDGRTSRKIAKEVGVHFSTISSWWKKWVSLGIAEYVSASGGNRAKRIFSLNDFGIDIK